MSEKQTRIFYEGLDRQIEQLRLRWAQAHYVKPSNRDDWYSFFLPGFLLPKGWSHTICTAIFQARLTNDGLHQSSPLSEFWVDIPDLHLVDEENRPVLAKPKRTWNCRDGYDGSALPIPYRRAGIWDGVVGLPQWKSVRLFLWHVQEHNPYTDTLFTSAMVIRQRLIRVY